MFGIILSGPILLDIVFTGIKPEETLFLFRRLGLSFYHDIPKSERPIVIILVRRKVIAPDDAIIITEIGYEKLRYLTAYAVVITRTEVEFVELRSAALETAQRMLRDPEYDPCMDY